MATPVHEDVKTNEIVNMREHVRLVANSFYICVPRFLVRSNGIIPGDPVNVTVMSDGTLKIEFMKGEN